MNNNIIRKYTQWLGRQDDRAPILKIKGIGTIIISFLNVRVIQLFIQILLKLNQVK